MPSVSTSIKLDPETKDRVQKLAASRKRTAHWVMKEAIEQYVNREEHWRLRTTRLSTLGKITKGQACI